MKIINWLIVVLGIFGLIGVRFMEDQLFYDPFIEYFRFADQSLDPPTFEWIRLIVSHLFRFSLNLLFSAIVIHFMFRNLRWTFQGIVLISLVFAITFPLYLYCVSTQFNIGYLFSFYMRRFVIQPLILLLIVPMFYYRKRILENQNF